jgi:CHAT domain-containing protein
MQQMASEMKLEYDVALAQRYQGLIHFELGEYTRAIEHGEASVRRFRVLGPKMTPALHAAGAGTGNLGLVYSAIGDFGRAEAHFRAGLAAARRYQDRGLEQRMLQNLGSSHLQRRQPGKAMYWFQRALSIAPRSRNRTYEVSLLMGLGQAHTMKRRFATAGIHFEKALTLARSLKIAFLEVAALNSTAEAERLSGKAVAARHHFQQAANIANSVGILEGSWTAEAGLGRIEEQRGNLMQALRHYRLAIDATERARSQIGVPEMRVGFLEHRLAPYERAIALLIRRGDSRGAFELAEQARGRSFLDTLTRTESMGRPVTMADAQALARQTSGTLMVYHLGDRVSAGWAIAPNCQVMVLLPSRATIESDVAAYRRLISEAPRSARAFAAHAGLAHRLFAVLLEPFRPCLRTGRQIAVIPDGMLHYLPFETLTDRARHVIQDHTVVYAPSVSAIAELHNQKRQSGQRELLAFGDPARSTDKATRQSDAAVRRAYARRGFQLGRLPASREEVLIISSVIAGTKLHVGRAATEEALKSEPLADYKRLHFATHAIVDEVLPERSSIVLSPGADGGDDGFLHPSEILQLKLNSELVVLSACQTGLGKLVRGEGLVGLARSFFHAGAARLVVSLWPVNDIATSAFMAAFYRGLAESKSPTEAMREAKIAMLASPVPAYRHPYYWAPFILSGRVD